MSYIIINVIAISLATCAGLIISLVYCRLAVKYNSSEKPRGSRSSIPLFVTALLAEFWLASILAGALILAPQQADPWTMALGSAIVIWIGFIVPVLLVTHLFHGLSFVSAALDSAHWIIVMLVQAAVLHEIGLTRIA